MSHSHSYSAPTRSVNIDYLRETTVEPRQNAINRIANDRRSHLHDLFYAIKHKQNYAEISKPTPHLKRKRSIGDIDQDGDTDASTLDTNDPELAAFINKHLSNKTTQFDISIPPMSPSPPASPPRPTTSSSTVSTADQPGNRLGEEPSIIEETPEIETASSPKPESSSRKENGLAKVDTGVDQDGDTSMADATQNNVQDKTNLANDPSSNPPRTSKSAPETSTSSTSPQKPPGIPTIITSPATVDTPQLESISATIPSSTGSPILASPVTAASPSRANTATPALPPTASTSQIPYSSSANAASPALLTISPTTLSLVPPSSPSPSPSPFPSTSTSVAALSPNPPPMFSVPALSASYTSDLPDLPTELLKSRLFSTQKKKGKDKATASGGPDLYKLQVRAHHIGLKSFLGKGKRAHNVLSTHDWNVGLEEVRAMRAFERIDQLKQDKAWSFRQPKRQRAGLVQKSHWDHVLDEMRWLQTDFRQERRWKIATAYGIARQVKRWHKASPEKRRRMQVNAKPRPPSVAPPPDDADADADADEPMPMQGESVAMSPSVSGSGTGTGSKNRKSREHSLAASTSKSARAGTATGDGESGDLDADADGEVDDADGDADADADADGEGEQREPTADVDAEGDADGETDVADSSIVVKSEPGTSETVVGSTVGGDSSTAVDKSAPPSTLGGQAKDTQQRAAAAAAALAAQQASTAQLQKLVKFRSPVFALGAEATIIDPQQLAKLSQVELDESVSGSLNSLFPELQLYTKDFNFDPQSDKRFEESSSWNGRLSLVSNLLETKPLLVSTVDPAKTKVRSAWEPSIIGLLDDSLYADSRDVAPTTSALFSHPPGKKIKEVEKTETPVPPPSVRDPPTRATSLHWTPEEDALVIALHKQYGSHWNLIAEVFNATTNRPTPDNRIGWDLYDRWDKLAGPSSRKVLADGTEIPVEPPAYQPPVDKSGKQPSQYANFDGSRKRLRHLTVYDAMRKVQKKREITAAKQPTGGIPRRISMSMHESHNLPPRPTFTPMEWSNVKVEQDANKLRMRQQQVCIHITSHNA
ncbi:hypothetical protein T439DRAFT_24751 [Meredithblackwellia eburnea MCA 4105]